MKREILFRGICIETKQWVFGSKYNDFIISYLEVDKFLKESDLFQCNCIIRDVVTETIGQFTGLLDKNGVKVFEGDLLHIPGYYCEVKFIDGMFCSVYNHDEDGEILPLNELGSDRFEIIGNIHDA